MKKMTLFIVILVTIGTYAQDTIFVHTASAANTSGHITTLDHPDLNGNPSACLSYTHVWNPEGGSGIYNNNVDGLWYDGTHWTIYNEELVDMVAGASFFVMVGNTSTCVDHVATAANSFGHITDIDDPTFNNNNPGPYAFMNHYFNPQGVYNTGKHGTYYEDSIDRRSIYEEEFTDIPVGSAYKLLVADGSSTRFTHIATAENTLGNVTFIDNAALNNNPDAGLLVAHYWGVSGTDTQVYLPHTVGVYYIGTEWAIYNEDLADMPVGVAFDIVARDVDEVLSVDTLNDINIAIYPNPASEILTLESASIIDTVEIISITGRTIRAIEVHNNTISLPITSLSTGVYFVKITADNQTQTTRFIKE